MPLHLFDACKTAASRHPKKEKRKKKQQLGRYGLKKCSVKEEEEEEPGGPAHRHVGSGGPDHVLRRESNASVMAYVIGSTGYVRLYGAACIYERTRSRSEGQHHFIYFSTG
jgi:hypothetical protein